MTKYISSYLALSSLKDTGFIGRIDRYPEIRSLHLHISEGKVGEIWITPNTGQIHSVVVDKKYRNMGVGSHLVDLAEDKFRQQGLSVMFAETTERYTFWRRIGFTFRNLKDCPDCGIYSRKIPKDNDRSLSLPLPLLFG